MTEPVKEWCDHREWISNALHLLVKTSFPCPWCFEDGTKRQEPKKVRLWEVLQASYLKQREEGDLIGWCPISSAAINWFKEIVNSQRKVQQPFYGLDYTVWNNCLDEIHRRLGEELL